MSNTIKERRISDVKLIDKKEFLDFLSAYTSIPSSVMSRGDLVLENWLFGTVLDVTERSSKDVVVLSSVADRHFITVRVSYDRFITFSCSVNSKGICSEVGVSHTVLDFPLAGELSLARKLLYASVSALKCTHDSSTEAPFNVLDLLTYLLSTEVALKLDSSLRKIIQNAILVVGALVKRLSFSGLNSTNCKADLHGYVYLAESNVLIDRVSTNILLQLSSIVVIVVCSDRYKDCTKSLEDLFTLLSDCLYNKSAMSDKDLETLIEGLNAWLITTDKVYKTRWYARARGFRVNGVSEQEKVSNSSQVNTEQEFVKLPLSSRRLSAGDVLSTYESHRVVGHVVVCTTSDGTVDILTRVSEGLFAVLDKN